MQRRSTYVITRQLTRWTQLSQLRVSESSQRSIEGYFSRVPHPPKPARPATAASTTRTAPPSQTRPTSHPAPDVSVRTATPVSPSRDDGDSFVYVPCPASRVCSMSQYQWRSSFVLKNDGLGTRQPWLCRVPGADFWLVGFVKLTNSKLRCRRAAKSDATFTVNLRSARRARKPRRAPFGLKPGKLPARTPGG